MHNQILEELWEVRRNIEGENQKNLKKLISKFKKNQKKSPSRYFRGIKSEKLHKNKK